MRRPEINTTRLPKQLCEELGLKDSWDTGRPNRGRGKPLSRKERRKEERSQKKQHHQQPRKLIQPHIREEQDQGSSADVSSDDDASGRDVRAAAPTRPEPKSILKKRKRSDDTQKPTKKNDDAEILPAERKISRAVQEKLEEDDREIARLEKALGLKGKKKLPKSFEEDGLADILGDLGGYDSETDLRKRKKEGDEWLQNKRRKGQAQAQADVSLDEETDESNDDFDMDGEEDETGDDDDGDLLEESEGSDESSEGDSMDEFEGFEDEPEQPPKRIKENPYVAPIAPSSNDQPKYIPPSLRAAASTEPEALVRVRRQLQGQLNKLSEANLISILSEIEKMYQDHPRKNVTSTLIDLLLALIADRSALNDTFIILHAAFISAVYKVVGMDFGAELVQRIVEKFDEIYEDKYTSDHASKSKMLSNLMSLLSHLYNFHVIGSSLAFDYIRLLLTEINELNTELLLKIIKSSGPQLRQDDPSALKDIVMLVQPAVAQVGEAALSVRTKFMIEIITDLKNNRLKTGIAGTAIASEHITKMRKVLGTLNSRNLRASEPLRISRADIHNSSKTGKWWLVGASWKDPSMVNDHGNESSTTRDALVADTLDDDITGGEVDLGRLARAHRMNTDVRRSIFVAIMSATDCRDAYLRLTKLRLKRNQEAEIPRVLMHCATEEEAHNPYYTLIARKLCSEKKMRMAFMFSLWDIFKRMGERGHLDEEDDDFGGFDFEEKENALSTRAIFNLAKMFASLIVEGSLSLGILKILDFPYLQPKTKMFVEILLITVMIQSQQKSYKKAKSEGNGDGEYDEKALVTIFMKTTETPQVVAGLRYFMRKVVTKSDVVSSKRDKKLVKWACKMALDTLSIVAEGGSAA
ncbi:glycerol defect protein 1 suppressor [Nannizzia gypsea CBS 118893]|uniref:Glycerol defect protein 1 suppressor n=1 Tax=Arthroderma gypseum (strain ATCC MYA-4604 / CBS 118893) TaxID=535722 RepID=E4UXC1_ARTGP|nr:glycerol defect protein 1 suppressor [Nannizzia gypsea CBS 118893]EFR02708.1 glycerol defect protein 1 suppressor [Nannizzia gypsea CBS 118893]